MYLWGLSLGVSAREVRKNRRGITKNVAGVGEKAMRDRGAYQREARDVGIPP